MIIYIFEDSDQEDAEENQPIQDETRAKTIAALKTTFNQLREGRKVEVERLKKYS
ncbi:MAG: hypothetical protein ACM3X9_13900 [Bacillota bacterium]